MEVAAATGMKNPDNIRLVETAMIFWILHFVQNDSLLISVFIFRPAQAAPHFAIMTLCSCWHPLRLVAAI